MLVAFKTKLNTGNVNCLKIYLAPSKRRNHVLHFQFNLDLFLVRSMAQKLHILQGYIGCSYCAYFKTYPTTPTMPRNPLHCCYNAPPLWNTDGGRTSAVYHERGSMGRKWSMFHNGRRSQRGRHWCLCPGGYCASIPILMTQHQHQRIKEERRKLMLGKRVKPQTHPSSLS